MAEKDLAEKTLELGSPHHADYLASQLWEVSRSDGGVYFEEEIEDDKRI